MKKMTEEEKTMRVSTKTIHPAHFAPSSLPAARTRVIYRAQDPTEDICLGNLNLWKKMGTVSVVELLNTVDYNDIAYDENRVE